MNTQEKTAERTSGSGVVQTLKTEGFLQLTANAFKEALKAVREASNLFTGKNINVNYKNHTISLG